MWAPRTPKQCHQKLQKLFDFGPAGNEKTNRMRFFIIESILTELREVTGQNDFGGRSHHHGKLTHSKLTNQVLLSVFSFWRYCIGLFARDGSINSMITQQSLSVLQVHGYSCPS
jgi:hypothetical protein